MVKDFPDQTQYVLLMGSSSSEFARLGLSSAFLQVGIEHVRAADDIRISYDLDRDGWKIEQASKFDFAAGEDSSDPDWQEVAFIQAWARQANPDGHRSERPDRHDFLKKFSALVQDNEEHFIFNPYEENGPEMLEALGQQIWDFMHPKPGQKS